VRGEPAHIHEVPGASHTVHASPTLDVYLSHLTAFLAMTRDGEHHQVSVRRGTEGKRR
jgi:hypothetical protein